MMHSILRMIPGLSALRGRVRAAFFRALSRVASIEDTRSILSNELERQNLVTCPKELSACDFAPPYLELQRSQETPRRKRSCAIFITARFRSGSTLVWNVFRRLPGVTAYYEPFNERRWFDVRNRGSEVDPTHINVSDYWSEYDGLEELGNHFDERWKFEHLYMPEDAWNPAMEQYIRILIERARGRAVLQFNEVDMRLPWLRAKFPGAKILHVFRHPREQWCSTLPKGSPQLMGLTLSEFEKIDGFYLLRWGRDLRHYFPFLTLQPDAHPYELFYQIWKISYLFGCFHADCSVAFEQIANEPRSTLQRMFSAMGLEEYDLDSLVRVVQPQHGLRWTESPDAGRFAMIEAKVDAMFESYTARIPPSTHAHSRFSVESGAGRGDSDCQGPDSVGSQAIS